MKISELKFRFKQNQFLILYWLLIGFLVLSVQILFAIPIHGDIYRISLNDSYISARSIFGGYDAGSYLEGALQLLNISNLTLGANDYTWILWPPGMSVSLYFLGTIDLFFNHALLSGVLIQLIAATVTLGTLGRFYSRKFMMSFAIILVLITFSPFKDWILGVGLMYAEGPGIAFLVLAFTYLFTALRSFNSKDLTVSRYARIFALFGFLIAGAAYFRSPIDSLVLLSLPVYLVFVFIIWTKSNRVEVLLYSIFYAVYFLFTLPWRIFANNKFGIPITSWTGISKDTSWAYLSNEQLMTNKQNAWADGNINWGCILDSQTCGLPGDGSLMKLFAIALQNPVAFVRLRVPQFFETMGLPGWELYPSNGPVNVFQSILYCCFIALVSYKSFIVAKNKKIDFSFLLALVFFYGNYIIILFTHFESRYLLISTLLGIVIVIQSNYLLNFKLKSKNR